MHPCYGLFEPRGILDRAGYGGPLARTNHAPWTFGTVPSFRNLWAWTTRLHGHRGQDSVSCQVSDLLCDSGQKQMLPSFLLFFLPHSTMFTKGCRVPGTSLPTGVHEGITLIEISYLEEKDREKKVRKSMRWGK